MLRRRWPVPRTTVLRLRVATVALAGLASLLPAAASEPRQWPAASGSATARELRREARSILREVEDHQLSLTAARVRVERLLNALKGLAEAEGWTPIPRRLELTIARPDDLDMRIEEECPLFYEEELVELCPLDASRSEIWGNQVLVCAFLCVPPDQERAPE